MLGWNVLERVREVVPSRIREIEADESYSEDDYEGLHVGNDRTYAMGEPPSVHEISPFIDEIEEMICSGARVPMTSKALVDQEQCLTTLDMLRANWPLDVLEAQRVLAKEGQVLEQADAEAQAIRERAEREAVLILEKSQLVRMAEVRAREVIDAAQQDAARTRDQAQQDARDVYAGLERELDLLMRDIKELVAARLRRLGD
jgi:hypothetical protein